jgi:hypothetical protein
VAKLIHAAVAAAVDVDCVDDDFQMEIIPMDLLHVDIQEKMDASVVSADDVDTLLLVLHHHVVSVVSVPAVADDAADDVRLIHFR